MIAQQVLPIGGLGPPVDVAFGGTVVPEPASWATLVAGLFLFGAALRRATVAGQALPGGRVTSAS
jgi:hypothetical protein